MRRVAVLAVLVLAALAAAIGPVPASPAQRTAHVLSLDGAIGPATAAYLTEGIDKAVAAKAQFVVIEMDTPGGLDASMRSIIQKILAAPVPVVTYVHPSGARAASAGTYILYASHVAAMTPGTNLGAATPVQLGGAPPQPGAEEGKDGKEAPAGAQERKAVNDAVAYIRSLAELRGRNADWGERAVREAESLTAEAAVKDNVVDIVAKDLASLLQQLDGRTVDVQGAAHRFDTSEIALTRVDPSWTDRFLATITDPNVALILMMVGVYGLFFEFWNPGTFIPGTVGAISLLLGLYALAVLPVDLVGLALILLGLALLVGEAFAPSFGILGLGGIVSFVIGATMLIDTEAPAFQLDWSIILALAVFSAGILIAVARTGLRSRDRPVQTGTEEMVGAAAEVLDWNMGAGHVFVHSERWNATGPADLKPGESVQVVSVTGLRVTVSRMDEPG